MVLVLPLVLLLLLSALLFGLVLRRHGDLQRRARVLRRIALAFMSVYVVFVGLFVIGETFADPGGWEALGLVALWLVPLVGLGAFAWFLPDRAVVPLTIATGAMVAMNLWYAFDSQHWRTFENAHGPVRGVAAFALCAVLGAFSHRRPLPGSILLLIASILPGVLSILATGRLGLTSLGALTAPAAVVGILYLCSTTFDGSTSTTEPDSTRPQDADSRRGVAPSRGSLPHRKSGGRRAA